MTYKKTLFFIAKCLTVNHEEKNKTVVKETLKSKTIDWDSVVKVSTAHYIFPALYCNLKRANLVEFLPTDLIEYMIHITDLNRKRNQQIIEQAKEINDLLLANSITPIFLKGTGNLLEGLYEDIAERMVGDIDFIVDKEDLRKTNIIMLNNGYKPYHDRLYIENRHLKRLISDDKIAAVEIHKEMTDEKYTNEFNYTLIKKSSQNFDAITVLNFENQLILSILAKQINDHGFYYKNISLRNAYDVFLLSKKTNAFQALNRFEALKNPLHCFLASCFEVFEKVPSLAYDKTKETEAYLNQFHVFLNDKKKRERHFKKVSRKIFINYRLNILYKSFYNKKHRKWLISIITDKNWQNRKLVQLGIKKTKANA